MLPLYPVSTILHPLPLLQSLKSFIPELYALSINGALDGNTPVKNSAMELGVQLMQVYPNPNPMELAVQLTS